VSKPNLQSSQTRRAPAPGEVSTRQPETEQNYLKRALWFEGHTARHLSLENPGPLEVAAYALERREEWSKSTWRQMKAALIFRYVAMGTQLSLEAADILRDGHQSVCVSKTGRTSARRAKTVHLEDLEDVITRIRASTSKYAFMLETWLLLGAEIGLRPHEWGQAQLIFSSPLELGDVDAVDADQDATLPQPYLRIKNAKATNGRSHGEFRHLNLSRLRPGLTEMVGEFSELMTDVVRDGLYRLYYESCRKLLYRINVDIHGKKPGKWIQLYSPRHKFSADAKKALGTGGVAAVMGHATTKTASEHYGRRITATGSLGPRPIAAEVIRIRQVRGHKSRTKAAPVPSMTVEIAGPST
jgi:hypothetical protein